MLPTVMQYAFVYQAIVDDLQARTKKEQQQQQQQQQHQQQQGGQ
jgi:hypothetical protein